MAEQKRRTQTNIFQTLIETQSSDEQLDLGVVDMTMILNMNVKVVVALNPSLKLLPVQVDLKSDLDLESLNRKPQKLHIF